MRRMLGKRGFRDDVNPTVRNLYSLQCPTVVQYHIQRGQLAGSHLQFGGLTLYDGESHAITTTV